MRPRVRLLTSLAAAGLLVVTAPTPTETRAALAAGDLGTLLAALCGALAGLVAAGLAVAALLVLAAALPGRVGAVADAIARRCVPRVLRASLVSALSLTGLAVPAGVAAADTHRPATTRLVPDLDRPAVGRPALVPLATPLATPTRAPTATPNVHHTVTPPAPVTPAVRRGTTPVLVSPGDTLWSIAAQALGPHATARAVAAAWPRWWQANRAVIGDDPDLIRPGQQLTPPTTGTREDQP